MSLLRRKGTRLLALLLAATVGVLAACSSGSPQASDENAVMAGVLGTNPPNFNRYVNNDVGSLVLANIMFDTLVKIDPQLEVSPSVATEWTISPDGRTYTFTLRDDVTFWDGQPLTSADVVYSLSTYLKLSSTSAAYAGLIERFDAPDPQTVVLGLSRPYTALLRSLAEAWILPKHVYDNGQDPATNSANMSPVGSGPYSLRSFQPGAQVELAANQNYWGGAPTVPSMVFRISPDATSRQLALEGGDVDYSYGAYNSNASLGRFAQDEDRYALLETYSGFSSVVGHLNTTEPRLSDPAVRRAIYQAINREEIVRNVYFGYAQPARGPLPAQMSSLTDPSIDFQQQLPYSPDTARSVLAGSGVGATPLRIVFQSNYPAMAGVAGVIQSNLQAVGVPVDLVGVDTQIFQGQVYRDHDYDIALTFYSSVMDPSLGIARIYLCNPTNAVFNNPTGLCDPGIDQSFGAAAAEGDPATRAADFAAAERRVAEVLPTMPLVGPTTMSVVRSDRYNFAEVTSVYPPNWAALRTGTSTN